MQFIYVICEVYFGVKRMFCLEMLKSDAHWGKSFIVTWLVLYLITGYFETSITFKTIT